MHADDDIRMNNGDHLPSGMDAAEFTRAVAGSGYPLQMYAARVLKDLGFWVQEEWAYTDRDGGLRRAIDMFAGRAGEPCESPAGRSTVSVELLIECKQSRHPFVFFEAINPPSQSDHPSPICNPGQFQLYPHSGSNGVGGSWFREVSLGTALDIPDLPFIASTAIAASMSIARPHGKKIAMSGDEAYRELLLPLTKATGEHRALRMKQRSSRGEPQVIEVPFSIALLDAPMFLVKAADLNPVPIERLRMFVRDPIDPDARFWSLPRVHFVEVVQKSEFARFLSEELSEFMRDYEERVTAHHQIVLSGEARVECMIRNERLVGPVRPRLHPK